MGGLGSLEISVNLVFNYSFLDYLNGGTQIALTIGIDFTASNGLPTRKGTLHYVGETTLNSYEQAIRTCGDIVAQIMIMINYFLYLVMEPILRVKNS